MDSNIKNRTIFCRDNIDILQAINSNSIDLIYLDPPFNTKKKFTAPIGSSAEGASFLDIFTEKDIKEEWLQTIKEDHEKTYVLLNSTRNLEGRTSYNFCYLAYMAIRLIECQRVLKDTGSLYLHCDPTMSHYLKLLLDCIFGESNFRNEIIWHYPNRFSRLGNFFSFMNDTLFFYSKTDNYIFENLAAKPSDRTMKSYERGWDAPADALLVYDEEKAHAKIIEYEQKNKRIKYVNPKQINMGNVWTDINIINSQAKERTGYPTQKPLALLERIIKASSNEGDIVLDPFCGCATTCVAAEQLNRQWVGIDISVKAYELVQKRLAKEVEWEGSLFQENLVSFKTDIPKRTDTGADGRIQKYVYIISHKNYPNEYKVGIAKNVDNRLNSYQTSDPNREYKEEYRFLTPHFRETERYIHQKYDNKHEWVTGKLADIMSDIESYVP